MSFRATRPKVCSVSALMLRQDNDCPLKLNSSSPKPFSAVTSEMLHSRLTAIIGRQSATTDAGEGNPGIGSKAQNRTKKTLEMVNVTSRILWLCPGDGEILHLEFDDPVELLLPARWLRSLIAPRTSSSTSVQLLLSDVARKACRSEAERPERRMA